MSVLSSQRVQITLAAGTASASTNITLAGTSSPSTNYLRCVPFMSKYPTTLASPEDNFQQQAVDITFATGPDRVIATTSDGTTRALTVEVGVVEFDGTDIVVNSGTFQLLDTELSTTENPGLTDIGNAFMVHTYLVGAGAHTTYPSTNVRPVVTSASVLTFDRGDATTTQIDGHWYTVESTDASFTVLHRTINIAVSTSSNTVTDLGGVDTAKTFLMGGVKGGGADDPDGSIVDVVLTSGTTITATRSANPGSVALDWAGSAITFAGSEAVWRGTVAGTTAASGTPAYGTAGTLANCVIFTSGNSGSMTAGLCPGGLTADTGDAQAAWTLNSDVQAQYNRDTTAGRAVTISFEVIEWIVGAAAAPRRVMVR